LEKLKCNCCGNNTLEITPIENIGYVGYGVVKLEYDKKKFPIKKARFCTTCGNIMPFIEKEEFYRTSNPSESIWKSFNL